MSQPEQDPLIEVPVKTPPEKGRWFRLTVDHYDIGCCLGSVLGPGAIIGLFALSDLIFPGQGGSPIMAFLILALAIPIGAITGAYLLPFLVKRRNRKNK